MFVSGNMEVDGASYFDGDVLLYGAMKHNIDGSYQSFIAEVEADDGYHLAPRSTDGSANHNIIIVPYATYADDYDHATPSTHPTLFIHSVTDPDTDNTEYGTFRWNEISVPDDDNTEYGTFRWNEISVGGDNGSYFGTYSITEEVTIPVGSGNTPVVESTGNLAPANSIIRAVAVRVTDAPGGGATVVAVGRTGGGNTDEFIDDISTALTTTGNLAANSDGTLTFTNMLNASAATLTVTTDADVTGDEMKLRIVVYYDLITVPTG
jgi:hypothetical protein